MWDRVSVWAGDIRLSPPGASMRQAIGNYSQVESQVRHTVDGKDSSLQERVYAELSREFGIDEKVLRAHPWPGPTAGKRASFYGMSPEQMAARPKS